MQKQFSVILRDGILLRTRTVSFLSRTFHDGIDRLKQEGNMGKHEMIVGSSVIAALPIDPAAPAPELPLRTKIRRWFGITGA